MSCIPLFTEDFSAGIGVYNLLAGVFTWSVGSGGPYGNDMQHGTDTQTSLIQRPISAVGANAMSVKVKVVSAATGGSGYVQVIDSGLNGFIVVPRQDSSQDGAQRCGFNPNTGILYFAATLTVGQWYQIDVALFAGTNQSTATLTDLQSGLPLETKNFSVVTTTFNVSAINFARTLTAASASVEFSDLIIEFCSAGDYTATTTEAASAASVSNSVQETGLPSLAKAKPLPVPSLPVSRVVKVTPSYS